MNTIMKLIPLALVALVAGAPTPQAAGGLVGEAVALKLSDGTMKDLGTLLPLEAATVAQRCLALPADDSWTEIAVSEGAASSSVTGTACAHYEVYVYREACPTAIGLTPAGSAMLLGTDGNYTKTSYVRGTDIMQDVLAAYLACLDDLPPTADEQAADALQGPADVTFTGL